MFKFLIHVLAAIGSSNHSVAIANTETENQIRNVELQIQDETGNWRTCHVTVFDYQIIHSGMDQLARQFPGRRVRAVENGTIVDIY